MSIPLFNNTWIWFVVITIFRLLSIAHSSCDDLCGLDIDRIIVDDENVLEKVKKKFSKGKGTMINCFDTTKVTDMENLFNGYNNEIFKDFNEDISCWDTSGVTNMNVSRYLSLYLSHEYTYD